MLQTSISPTPLVLQIIINNHFKVFGETPKGLSPNIRNYRYPYAHESDIECMIHEMLEASIIQHIQSSFSSLVVLVTK
jgi:hypothetical protein